MVKEHRTNPPPCTFLCISERLCYWEKRSHRFPYIFRSIEGVWISTKLFYIVGSLSLLSIITLAIEIAFYVYRHGVRHRRLFSRRTAGARPHLQYRVRRLTRRRDIRDAVHESFLTRRQQHRRPIDLGRLYHGDRPHDTNDCCLGHRWFDDVMNVSQKVIFMLLSPIFNMITSTEFGRLSVTISAWLIVLSKSVPDNE